MKACKISKYTIITQIISGVHRLKKSEKKGNPTISKPVFIKLNAKCRDQNSHYIHVLPALKCEVLLSGHQKTPLFLAVRRDKAEEFVKDLHSKNLQTFTGIQALVISEMIHRKPSLQVGLKRGFQGEKTAKNKHRRG